MVKLVCDRCKKVINVVNDEPRRLIIKDGLTAIGIVMDTCNDKNVDLCSNCFNIFNTFMLNEESDNNDEPVTVPITDDEIFNSEKAMEIVKPWDKRR